MHRILFLILMLSISAFAYDNVYAWGYGEMLQNILDAIRFLISGNGMSTIFKVVVAIAFLVFGFKKAIDDRNNPTIELAKLMLMIAVIWNLFLSASNDDRHKIMITDLVTGDNYVVEQIPTGIGKPLALISQLEYAIADKMEKYFSMPDSITYRNSGIGFPLQVQARMNDIDDGDIYFHRTFDDFIMNCTIYEISEGSKDANAILTSNDLLAALNPNGDTRLTKVYTASNPDGEVKDCSETYNYISNTMGTKINDLLKIGAALNSTKLALFQNRLDAVPQLFFNASSNGRDYLQQNFLTKLASNSFINAAKATGLPADTLAYASAIADQTTKTNFFIGGMLAKEYLPIAKGALTIIIVGLSWIMALLAVMFMDYRYIKMYITLLLWLLLWTPILVIINYMADYYASKVFTAVYDTTGQMVTLYTKGFVDSKTQSTLAWLGYLAWITPLLALSIVKASEHGFALLASSLSASANAGATEGARTGTQMSTAPKPTIQTGGRIYSDVGGAVSAMTNYAYQNHNLQEQKITTADGRTTITESFDNGSSSVTATDGKVTSAQVQGAVELGMNRVSQLMDSYSQTKQHLQSAVESYGTTASHAISQAVQSGKTISEDFSKGYSAEERQMVANTFSEASKNIFSHSEKGSRFFEDMAQLQGKAGVGINIFKIASGGVGYTFTTADGKQYSYEDTEQGAYERLQNFQKSLSATMAQSTTFRESMNKTISQVDSETATRMSQLSQSISDTYQRMEAEQKLLQNAQAFSIALKSNGLVVLENEMVQKEVQNGMNWEDAVKKVHANITDIVNRGDTDKLYDLFKAYNVYDKLERTGELGHVDVSAIDRMRSTKPNDIPGVTTPSALNREFGSVKDVQDAFGEYKSGIHGVGNTQGEVAHNLDYYKNSLERSKVDRLKDGMGDELAIAGTAGAVANAAGIESLGALGAKFGDLPNDIKRFGAMMIDGAPLNPTNAGLENEGAIGLKAIERDSDIFSPEVKVNTWGGTYETNVNYDDMQRYLNAHPEIKRAVESVESHQLQLTSGIMNAQTPKELADEIVRQAQAYNHFQDVFQNRSPQEIDPLSDIKNAPNPLTGTKPSESVNLNSLQRELSSLQSEIKDIYKASPSETIRTRDDREVK